MTTPAAGYVPITSEAELRELLGEPSVRSRTKERARLHARDREWLAASPLGLIVKSVQDTAETLSELERHYGPAYAGKLYR